MKIKKFDEFLAEAISGTFDLMPYGPGFPRQEFPSTIDKSKTNVIFSELHGQFYTEDDWSEIYNNYLKAGGKPLDGFNAKNLEIVLAKINQ